MPSDVASHELFPHQHRPRRRVFGAPWSLVGVVAAGGALGALLRHGVSMAWPVSAHSFPWTTLVINVTGCFVIGVVGVVIIETIKPNPLFKPFFVTGFLGGYTTFSHYITDTLSLLFQGYPAAAMIYLALTMICCIAAVAFAISLTRLVTHSVLAPEQRTEAR